MIITYQQIILRITNERILIDKRGAGLTDNILNKANFTWAISPFLFYTIKIKLSVEKRINVQKVELDAQKYLCWV